MDPAARTCFSDENQRIIVKFLFFEGHSGAEIHRRLVKMLSGNALPKRTVQYWCQRFKLGNFDVEEHRGGDQKSGPLRDERVAAIEEAFQESRAWSLRSLSPKTGIPRETCRLIVTKTLKMKKILKKWIPHELTPAQVETRLVYSQWNLVMYNQQKSRLEHTVAVDETWVSLYRPPERDQARQWLRSGEASTSVVVPNSYGPKVHVILAMDFRGICYYEIMPQNETVKAPQYLAFLDRLNQFVGGNRQHTLWLLDDNATPHRAASVTAWIEANNIQRWYQPPYSPDLSPCDYGCFHALKRAIGGVQYPHIDSLRDAINKEIAYGNANGKYVAVQKLAERWDRCVNNKGGYV